MFLKRLSCELFSRILLFVSFEHLRMVKLDSLSFYICLYNYLRRNDLTVFLISESTFSLYLCCKQSGEERFSIEMDGNKQVWYEILSFSKPAHPLSVIGYPYVFLRQKYFAHQSSDAVRKFVSN